MLEFKILEELKPNPQIIELIKNYTYKTKKGKIKVLLHTNLQIIEPTEYLITHPITLTILEYKVNEISNKPFYIKEHKSKYNLKEIENIIKNTNIKFFLKIHFVKVPFSEETYERINFFSNSVCFFEF